MLLETAPEKIFPLEKIIPLLPPTGAVFLVLLLVYFVFSIRSEPAGNLKEKLAKRTVWLRIATLAIPAFLILAAMVLYVAYAWHADFDITLADTLAKDRDHAKRVLAAQNFFDKTDIPVNSEFVELVLKDGGRARDFVGALNTAGYRTIDQVDPAAYVQRGLDAHRDVFSKVLAEHGFYDTTDTRVIAVWAQDTMIEPSDDLQEAINRVASCFRNAPAIDIGSGGNCNPVVLDLRKKARDHAPPFNEAGLVVDAGLPSIEKQQPRRYYLNVTPEFPFLGNPISVRTTRRVVDLILWPNPVVTNVSDKERYLVQLNGEQKELLFGGDPILANGQNRAAASVIVRPVSSGTSLYDPACTGYWRKKDTLCALDERVTVAELDRHRESKSRQ